MGDLGARLRQARERAGLSLRQVSSRTKIKESTLDAIEREDFTRVPRGPFRRGFLRAFAHEVGLDPEAIVHEYTIEFEPTPVPANPTPTTHSWDVEESGGSRRRLWAVVAVAAAALFFFVETDLNVPQTSVPPVATTGDRETDSPARPKDSSADEAADSQKVDGLTLDIEPTGPVWVAAAADGKRVLYGLVYPGQRTTIQAHEEFVIRVGDAGAFQYSVNGARGHSLGGPAEVRDVRITRENYRTFQAQVGSTF